MTDIAQQHPTHARRVHRHAMGILVFAPLAIATGVGWVVLKALVCWNSRTGATEQQICAWAFVVPNSMLFLAGVFFAAMMVGLADLGALALKEQEGRSMRHAMRRGYGALEHVHRKHVQRASVALGWGFAAFVGVLAWVWFELPEWAAFAITVTIGVASEFAKRRLSVPTPPPSAG